MSLRLQPFRCSAYIAALLLLVGCTNQTALTASKSAGQQTSDQTETHNTPHVNSKGSANAAAKNPPLAPPLSDWGEYQRTLQGVKLWQVQGKLGIRLPGDSGSLYFNWQQRPENFAIHLSGPLGQGASWIRGGAPDSSLQQVSLERGKQPPVYADNLEALMHSTLGWALPVDELYYWVRGIPAPDLPIEQINHDEAGRLARLQQQGWTLRFERYKTINSWPLPGKIIAERDPLKLTFIIKNWKLSE